MARGCRWFGQSRRLKTLALTASSAALICFATTAALAAPDRVVHVYDIQVTATFRATFSVQAGSARSTYSEISTWTETYQGVRLEISPSELGNASGKEAKGTITGTIKVSHSSPQRKGCSWSTNRPEPSSLSLSGMPTPGATKYQLTIRTGRLQSRPALTSPNCPHEGGNTAKFARLTPGGGSEAGWVETRRATLTLVLPIREAGQPVFPLNRLQAGAGFVLALKGKTKTKSRYEQTTNEGTARIIFVPRSS